MVKVAPTLKLDPIELIYMTVESCKSVLLEAAFEKPMDNLTNWKPVLQKTALCLWNCDKYIAPLCANSNSPLLQMLLISLSSTVYNLQADLNVDVHYNFSSMVYGTSIVSVFVFLYSLLCKMTLQQHTLKTFLFELITNTKNKDMVFVTIDSVKIAWPKFLQDTGSTCILNTTLQNMLGLDTSKDFTFPSQTQILSLACGHISSLKNDTFTGSCKTCCLGTSHLAKVIELIAVLFGTEEACTTVIIPLLKWLRTSRSEQIKSNTCELLPLIESISTIYLDKLILF